MCVCVSKSGRTGDSRTDGVEHVLLTVSQTDQYGVSCSGDRRRRGLTPQTIVMTGRVDAWERKWDSPAHCAAALPLWTSAPAASDQAELLWGSAASGRDGLLLWWVTSHVTSWWKSTQSKMKRRLTAAACLESAAAQRQSEVSGSAWNPRQIRGTTLVLEVSWLGSRGRHSGHCSPDPVCVPCLPFRIEYNRIELLYQSHVAKYS